MSISNLGQQENFCPTWTSSNVAAQYKYYQVPNQLCDSIGATANGNNTTCFVADGGISNHIYGYADTLDNFKSGLHNVQLTYTQPIYDSKQELCLYPKPSVNGSLGVVGRILPKAGFPILQ